MHEAEAVGDLSRLQVHSGRDEPWRLQRELPCRARSQARPAPQPRLSRATLTLTPDSGGAGPSSPLLSAPAETESHDNPVPAGAQVRAVWAGTGQAGDFAAGSFHLENRRGQREPCAAASWNAARRGPGPASRVWAPRERGRLRGGRISRACGTRVGPTSPGSPQVPFLATLELDARPGPTGPGLRHHRCGRSFRSSRSATSRPSPVVRFHVA